MSETKSTSSTIVTIYIYIYCVTMIDHQPYWDHHHKRLSDSTSTKPTSDRCLQDGLRSLLKHLGCWLKPPRCRNPSHGVSKKPSNDPLKIRAFLGEAHY